MGSNVNAAPADAAGDAERSPLIDVDGLLARLGDPRLRIVDARFDLADPEAGRRAHAQSRLPGAVYAHLDEDLSDHARPPSEGRHPLPEAGRFAATLARWGITPDTAVVVHDGGSGAMAAARAWWLLRWMGHTDVRVLDGGWAAWRAAGAPIQEGPPSIAASAPRSFEPGGWHPGSVPLASVDAVAAPAPGVVLVDARAPERFRGEVEPLDPKAGHIPGARNRPFAMNLEAGRFKPAAQLREEWRALLPEGARPLLYCGSGVTACHNALALVHAGFPMPALFAPSWSGWVADGARAVATGDSA
jgi:thiosulfate/3-mercaptopyruvate sulfurtransferase